MAEVLRKLERAESLTVEELGAQLNHPRPALEKALKLLEVDGAVQREQKKFCRTANGWMPDLVRSDQVRAHRRAELAQIKAYVEHDSCLMEFLARALDDPSPSPGPARRLTGVGSTREESRMNRDQRATVLLRMPPALKRAIVTDNT